MISAPAFREWLASAALGDELVYHCGNLSDDSDPAWGARARELDALINEVLAAKKDGRVSLRQEPLPAKGACQHVARRIA